VNAGYPDPFSWSRLGRKAAVNVEGFDRCER
jgi:hypothetical protein